MLRELREYWFPLLLFAATQLIAIALMLALVIAPLVPFTHELIELLAHDATVRRTCLFAAIGLTVTAFVFFRPNASVLTRKLPAEKPSPNTMAGA